MRVEMGVARFSIVFVRELEPIHESFRKRSRPAQHHVSVKQHPDKISELHEIQGSIDTQSISLVGCKILRY